MSDVKSFAINPEESLAGQIDTLANCEAYRDSTIRVMPDGHPGKGAVVGSVITFKDKVVPSSVGVDIACRVSLFDVVPSDVNLAKLDCVVHENVPTGFSVRERECDESKSFPYDKMRFWHHLTDDERNRCRLSMGTMGGSNHMVELDVSKDTGNLFMLVHCGTRTTGAKAFSYYQDVALANRERFKDNLTTLFKSHIDSARQTDVTRIQPLIDLRNSLLSSSPDDDLCWLDGYDLADYLADMELLNEWSLLNHKAIFHSVAKAMGWDVDAGFVTCAHNYVDVEHKVIRKGAISLRNGEVGLIPLNMRDGVLRVKGKGNEDWLCSGPHGAGRIGSRKSAREAVSMDEFKASMGGVYTTCVREETKDESPMAYKDATSIEEAIKPTADVIDHLLPVYNYKDVPAAKK